MSVFLVSYDLNKQGQDYKNLINAIQTYDGYISCLKSQWLIATTKSCDDVCNHLKSKIDKNDSLFIVKLVKPYQGWLSKDVIDWLDHHSNLGHIPHI